VPSQFGNRLPGGLLQLRRQAPRRPAPVVSASSAAMPAIPEEDKKPGFMGIAPITWKKIVPLGFMFFCILFNYTILRDTKARPRGAICPKACASRRATLCLSISQPHSNTAHNVFRLMVLEPQSMIDHNAWCFCFWISVASRAMPGTACRVLIVLAEALCQGWPAYRLYVEFLWQYSRLACLPPVLQAGCAFQTSE